MADTEEGHIKGELTAVIASSSLRIGNLTLIERYLGDEIIAYSIEDAPSAL